MKIRLAPCIPLALALSAAAWGEDTPIKTLTLHADPAFPGGKVALLQGNSSAAGDIFEVEGTDLLSPVSVAVLTRDPSHPVHLGVGKGDWKHPPREGNTDAQGQLTYRFRTYDGFKMKVSADSSAPYQLLVWVGDPIEKPVPPMTVPMSRYRGAAGSAPAPAAAAGPDKLPLIISGISLLFAGFASFAWFRANRRNRA